jgi:hypothetical protein
VAEALHRLNAAVDPSIHVRMGIEAAIAAGRHAHGNGQSAARPQATTTMTARAAAAR